jgi:glycosyltransferase involved in cell wall biosynthesis
MQGCSIVIRAFNEGENIGRLLRGISAQSVQDREVIIVDSGSTDGTLGVAGQYPVKVLHLSKDDFSFGRSLNMGCAAATGELIVLASAHVFPIYSDWLEELLEPFSDPRLALSYGKQRGTDRTQYAEHQVFAKWFPDISNPDQSHPFCNNANAAIRRSVWEKLPYDETLTGLEDIDWAHRASRMGYRIAYRAAAEVAHLHDETPMRTYNRYLREAIAYKRIFPQERFSFSDFLKLWLLNTMTDYYHAVKDGKLVSGAFSIPVFRLMQFWGAYRGSAQTRSVDQRLRQKFYYPRGIQRMPDTVKSGTNGRRIDYRVSD